MRHRIFLYLLLLTVAALVQRSAISVAAVPMMPQLGLSQVQIGWLETGFLTSYTALQFPGGVVGAFVGAHRMLAWCGAVAVLATLAVPLMPSLAHGVWLFATLLLAQCVLGAAQGPLFPMVSATLERWYPRSLWGATQGLSSGGVGLGAAVAPALISELMVTFGWRWALVLVAAPVSVLVGVWWHDARDRPVEHRGVTADELADLPQGDGDSTNEFPRWRAVWSLLVNRDLMLLALSYLLMNFVFYLVSFWSFLYLVQARHFSVLQGGFGASLPPLAGAVGAGVGGIGASWLTARWGARAGLRLLPMLSLPAAGLLLLLAVHGSALAALAGLALAFGLIEVNEGSFWAASMEIGRTESAVAGAILNTGGNLGGIVATPIIAALSGGGDWTTPFLAGAACSIASALLWPLINAVPQRGCVMMEAGT